MVSEYCSRYIFFNASALLFKILCLILCCFNLIHFLWTWFIYRHFQPRSSRPEVFCKIGVLRNFAKIHKKAPVPESLFNKVAGLRPATLSKKRIWHRCFSVNFAKFLRTLFVTEHLWWLLLSILHFLIKDCYHRCHTFNSSFESLLTLIKGNHSLKEPLR